MLVLVAIAALAQPPSDGTFGGEPRSLEGQVVISRRYNIPSPAPTGTISTTRRGSQLDIVVSATEEDLPTGTTGEAHIVVRIELVNSPTTPCRVERTTELVAGESTTVVADLNTECRFVTGLYSGIGRGWAYIGDERYVVQGGLPFYFRFDGSDYLEAEPQEWSSESNPDTTEPEVPAESALAPAVDNEEGRAQVRHEIESKGLSTGCEASLLEALTTRDLNLTNQNDAVIVAAALQECRGGR